MPNRIIKESICTSDSVDMLTPFQETVFIRLIVNCDDFGRFDGRPKIIAARLFPLRHVSTDDIVLALDAMEDANLITRYSVDDKPYIQMATWSKHQQTRAVKSKYPPPSDVTCNQMISDDYKCPRIRIRNSDNDIRYSDSVSDLSDGEAKKTAGEHNQILEAAENAGFPRSPTLASMLIALYADYGLERMLSAINECVTHSAVNIAYLKAVLSGKKKKEKPATPFHAFKQRDEDLNELAKQQMDAEMAEFMRRDEGG